MAVALQLRFCRYTIERNLLHVERKMYVLGEFLLHPLSHPGAVRVEPQVKDLVDELGIHIFVKVFNLEKFEILKINAILAHWVLAKLRSGMIIS